MRDLSRTVPDVRARGNRSAGASKTAAEDGGLQCAQHGLELVI